MIGSIYANQTQIVVTFIDMWNKKYFRNDNQIQTHDNQTQKWQSNSELFECKKYRWKYNLYSWFYDFILKKTNPLYIICYTDVLENN